MPVPLPAIRQAMVSQWWWFVWDLVHIQEAIDHWAQIPPAEHAQRWVPETVSEARVRERDGRPSLGLTGELSWAIWMILTPEQKAMWLHGLGRLVDHQWDNELTDAEQAAWVQAAAAAHPGPEPVEGQGAAPGIRLADVYRTWPKLRRAQLRPDHMGQLRWTGEEYEY